MDFRLYARVLWRFRVVMAIGLALAIAAAALSVVRVGPTGVSYRQQILWSSSARLGVTQYGFPWGRLFAQNPVSGTEGKDQIPIADPNRFNWLAVLYAELASSDQVLAVLRREGPIRGQIVATALRDADSNTMLPLIDVTAVSTSPELAVRLASRSVHALQSYLEQQQLSSDVPTSDRVVLEQVVRPSTAVVFRPRSKTLPVVIFLAVMFAAVGLTFVLENLRPRFQESGDSEMASIRRAARRRTA